MPRKSPSIDMTPMVDLFTLLLTFFMLTTSFKPTEAVIIDSPSSISEKVVPENNIMTIYISKDNKIFFNLDNGADSSKHIRSKVLTEVGKQHNITFTEKELSEFEKMSSFGFPIENMKDWINAEDNTAREKYNIGMPIDSADNQLHEWVLYTAFVFNQEGYRVEAAIKGDGLADYTTAKKVFDVLQENKLNKFSLTTNLEKVEINISDFKK